MQSQIPLPTDNIYKFYALFGLLLFVFGCGAILYHTHASNDAAIKLYLDMQPYKNVENLSATDLAKKDVLQAQLNIELSDRKFISNALVGLTAFGLLLMAFGFFKWHTTVQPREDELVELRLKQLRFEVEKLAQSKADSITEISSGGN